MTKEQELHFLENLFREALEREEKTRKESEERVEKLLRDISRKERHDKTHKATQYMDEYGNIHTRYTRLKSAEERLQDQLRSEIERPGDMVIKRDNKEVVIPKEFFSKKGTVLPSKREEYKDLLLLLEEEGA